MSFVERCRQRHLGSEGGDEGFTLIELLVVLLIIGILLAIAIPTYLSITKGANDTAAQSNLQTALTGAKAFYTDGNQSYSGIMTAAGTTSSITQVDTGVSYTSTSFSNGPHVVSIGIDNSGTAITMVALANGTHNCWGIYDNTAVSSTSSGPTGATAVGTYFFVLPHVATGGCTAAAGDAATSVSTTGFPKA
ncbi:MAG: prepilin-type N-terminal cleavage/methylation domain-containing protein [Acidimicrobiales bacterium]